MYQYSSNFGSAAKQSTMCFVTDCSWQQVVVLPLLTYGGDGRLQWKYAPFFAIK